RTKESCEKQLTLWPKPLSSSARHRKVSESFWTSGRYLPGLSNCEAEELPGLRNQRWRSSKSTASTYGSLEAFRRVGLAVFLRKWFESKDSETKTKVAVD